MILTAENEEYFLEMNSEIGVSTLSTLLLKQFLKSLTELRKEDKLTLLADDMVLDLKVPQNFIKKLFTVINTFSKVTLYKLSQNKLLFYTSNKPAEKNQSGEIHTSSQWTEYLRRHLSKEVKELQWKLHNTEGAAETAQ